MQLRKPDRLVAGLAQSLQQPLLLGTAGVIDRLSPLRGLRAPAFEAELVALDAGDCGLLPRALRRAASVTRRAVSPPGWRGCGAGAEGGVVRIARALLRRASRPSKCDQHVNERLELMRWRRTETRSGGRGDPETSASERVVADVYAIGARART